MSPQEGTGGSANGAAPEPAEPTAGTETAALLSGLPDERRAEVEDHLRHVVRGIERDADDAEEEAAVRDLRFAHDRTRRVPLFFTADPLPPRPPDRSEDSGWLPNVASGWGLAVSAFVGGLVLALAHLGEDGAESPESPDSPTPGNNWPTGSGTVTQAGPGSGRHPAPARSRYAGADRNSTSQRASPWPIPTAASRSSRRSTWSCYGPAGTRAAGRPAMC